MSESSGNTETEEKSDAKAASWMRPNEVLALHRLKLKKKALQARMNRTCLPRSFSSGDVDTSTKSFQNGKRKNPFVKNNENKKPKSNNTDSISPDLSPSSDTTLFQLFNLSSTSTTTPVKLNMTQTPLTSFSSILNRSDVQNITIRTKTDGEKWIPIDWTLKKKVRFMSLKPFAWNRKLKTSEEASGITGFVRCLDTRTGTTLDTSPNAQFHQGCLYWQHPCIPWVELFPRSQGRVSSTTTSLASTAAIRECLQSAWTDSLRSLFQLIRSRQCPYFYVCANTFTAVFRAGGICGYTEMNAMVTPTTRGFRQMLRQEDIEFMMPLKKKRLSTDRSVDLGYDTQDSVSQQASEDSSSVMSDPVKIEDEEPPNEEWLQSLGVTSDDIKRINVTQAKIQHRTECELDNSEQSLVFLTGIEAHALYNFLINCKSIITTIGPLAGIPPTLLAPVAFHGASLQSLKVRENKICDCSADYYSLELSGPVLPHTIHNFCSLLSKDCNVTATFTDLSNTVAFSKVTAQMTGKPDDSSQVQNFNESLARSVVFGQENLSDCGLNKEILKHFCSPNPDYIQHVESLKYNSETDLYTWL